MYATLTGGLVERLRLGWTRRLLAREPRADGLAWTALPVIAQLYVALVVAGGAVVLLELFPLTSPQPLTFALALLAACLTAAWKINLPIPLASGSTLSASCAAKLMALLLLGPGHAVVIAVAGALTQCTYKVKQAYPLYRTVFSMMAEAVAMGATGMVYGALGGSTGPFDIPFRDGTALPPTAMHQEATIARCRRGRSLVARALLCLWGPSNGIGTWGVSLHDDRVYLSYICTLGIPFPSNWTGGQGSFLSSR
jgi:hypothetical protein